MPDDIINNVDSGNNGTGPDWRAPYQSDATLGPIVSKLTEPDLPTVIKSYSELKSHLGKAVFVKDLNNQDEVKKARTRAYELGLFPKPPEAPEKYEIKHDPSNLGLVEKFRSVAFEEGLSQGAVEKIVGTFNDYISSLTPALQADNEKAMESLNSWAKEIKKDPAELMGMADDFLTKLFENDPVGQEWLKNPAVKSALTSPSAMKAFGTAALYAREDSGVTGSEGINVQKAGQAQEEANDITKNESNPKFKQYWSGDKATVDYVNRLWEKAHPGTREL